MAINMNHPLNMNNNDGQATPLAIDVTELPYDISVQMMDRQLNHRMAFYNNHRRLRFGQTIPYVAAVNNRYRMQTIKRLAAGFLLLLILGYIRVASNAPSLDTEDIPAHDALILAPLNDIVDLVAKEENSCFCPNAIGENNIDAYSINDEIVASAIMFQETLGIEIIDDSTCALYDMFLYVFTQLCCLKDHIIGITPTDAHDGIDKTAIELGQTLPTTDHFFASKIEPGDMVSTEDACSTNIYIPKETDPIDSSQEVVEKNAT